MFERLYEKLGLSPKEKFNKMSAPKTLLPEEPQQLDEIEKALWDIKESLDLPTEEIEIAVATRLAAIKDR